MSLGILVAFLPLIFWALGDFFIQKTVKKTGVVNSLFYIASLGTILLFPFIMHELSKLTLEIFFILSSLGALIFIYATLLFKSFELGKLSVVESIVALELPMTVTLSLLLLDENINNYQLFLIGSICIGIFLSCLKWDSKKHHLGMILEKGSFFALAGSALSAFTNFTIGTSAQQIDPVFTIWFTHAVLALICFIYLTLRGRLTESFRHIKKYPKVITISSFADNIAWLGYAFSVTLIPISISISISESYIILAALLGYFVNKEKLSRIQKFGMLLTFTLVFLLSLTVK